MITLKLTQNELDYLRLVLLSEGPFMDDAEAEDGERKEEDMAFASLAEKLRHLEGQSAVPPDANRVWEALKSMV